MATVEPVYLHSRLGLAIHNGGELALVRHVVISSIFLVNSVVGVAPLVKARTNKATLVDVHRDKGVFFHEVDDESRCLDEHIEDVVEVGSCIDILTNDYECIIGVLKHAGNHREEVGGDEVPLLRPLF